MHITHTDLLNVISNAEPIRLQAIDLKHRADAGQPIGQADLAAATTELVAYTDDCKRLVDALSKCAPVPCDDPEMVMDYPL